MLKIPSYSVIPPSKKQYLPPSNGHPSMHSASLGVSRCLFPFLDYSDLFNLAQVNRAWFRVEEAQWKSTPRNEQIHRITIIIRTFFKLMLTKTVEGLYDFAFILGVAKNKVDSVNLNAFPPNQRALWWNKLGQLPAQVSSILAKMESGDCEFTNLEILQFLKNMNVKHREVAVLAAASLSRVDLLRLLLLTGKVSPSIRELALVEALHSQENGAEVVVLLQQQ